MRCISFDLCRDLLSSTRSAKFNACLKLLIRMLSIAKTLILESRYDPDINKYKIAVLSKLMTNVGQRIDGLIVVCEFCLFDCLQLVN